MHRGLLLVLFLLLIVVVAEVFYLIDSSLFSYNLNASSCNSKTQQITDKDSPCNYQIVKLRGGSTLFFIKSDVKNLTLNGDKVSAEIHFPWLFNISLPLKVQLGYYIKRPFITICSYPETNQKVDNPKVFYSCAQATPSSIINQIKDRGVMFVFESNPQNGKGASECDKTNSFINIFEKAQGYFNLLPFTHESSCKPIVAQLFL